MVLFSAIVFAFVVPGYLCDLQCFYDAFERCMYQWGIDNDAEGEKVANFFQRTPEFPVCKWEYELYAECNLEAAVECDEDFIDQATLARNEYKELCTEGTYYWQAVQNDPNCNLTVFYNPLGCMILLAEQTVGLAPLDSKEKVERFKDIVCKTNDIMRMCKQANYRELCTREVENIFATVFVAGYQVTRTICMHRERDKIMNSWIKFLEEHAPKTTFEPNQPDTTTFEPNQPDTTTFEPNQPDTTTFSPEVSTEF